MRLFSRDCHVLFYTIFFTIKSTLLIVLYRAFHCDCSKAETQCEQHTVISSSGSPQVACNYIYMSIMYLHSCQPRVLKQSLETIATDQTHLRYLLSITLLSSFTHMVSLFSWFVTMPAAISETRLSFSPKKLSMLK